MDTLDLLYLSDSDAELVTRKLMEYYGYYRQMFGVSTTRDGKACWWRKSSKLQYKAMWGHLTGYFAIGTFAGEHATKFITIDVDTDDRYVVRRVVTTMMSMGIPFENIYVSYSGKKGYHVDLFFKDKIMNGTAYQFYVMLLDKGGLARRKVEFRPTNGNCVKMPLGMHQETGNRCWFVNPITLAPIKDFKYILGIKPIEEDFFNDLVRKHGKEYLDRIYKEMKEAVGKNNAGVSVGDNFTITAPGQRHNLQVKVAVSARYRGCSRGGIYLTQMNWYQQQDKSLISTPIEDVMVEANQIADWVESHVPIGEKPKELNTPAPEIYIRQEHIPYIIGGKTETERMVAFVIWVYSLRFNNAKLAYQTIAEKIGKKPQTVITAIKNLVENKQIYKGEPAYHEKNGFRVRDSNTYLVPGRCYRKLPDGYENYPDSVAVTEWLTPETTERVYYSVITSMCSMEYLAKYLKKPELAKCEQYLKLNEKREETAV